MRGRHTSTGARVAIIQHNLINIGPSDLVSWVRELNE